MFLLLLKSFSLVGFALELLFLPLTSFTFCHANHDCLSSEFLILLIWPWINSTYSFWYVFSSSHRAFLSFYTLALVRFLLLSKDSFFHIIPFFSKCYWLPVNSIFSSWFGCYAFWCCFYLSWNKVFIFVIQRMCFRCHLKCIKLWIYLAFFTSSWQLPFVSIAILWCCLNNLLHPQRLLSSDKMGLDNYCRVLLLQIIHIWGHSYWVSFICLEFS